MGVNTQYIDEIHVKKRIPVDMKTRKRKPDFVKPISRLVREYCDTHNMTARYLYQQCVRLLGEKEALSYMTWNRLYNRSPDSQNPKQDTIDKVKFVLESLESKKDDAEMQINEREFYRKRIAHLEKLLDFANNRIIELDVERQDLIRNHRKTIQEILNTISPSKG